MAAALPAVPAWATRPPGEAIVNRITVRGNRLWIDVTIGVESLSRRSPRAAGPEPIAVDDQHRQRRARSRWSPGSAEIGTVERRQALCADPVEGRRRHGRNGRARRSRRQPDARAGGGAAARPVDGCPPPGAVGGAQQPRQAASPASEAGLKAGDIVLGGDWPMLRRSLDGPPGTVVSLQVETPAGPAKRQLTTRALL